MSTSIGTSNPTFKIPNCLILDGSLNYTARKLGAVLYAHRNRFGSCRKSLAELSALTGLATSTVRAALLCLDAAGYITRTKNFTFHRALNRVVYDKSTYHMNTAYRGGYTSIPRAFLRCELLPSGFVVGLYLYHQAGNTHRAFPSLSGICAALQIAKPTVCRALRVLEEVKAIFKRACRKVTRDFSSNSYFILRAAACAAAQSDITVVPQIATPLRCVGALVKSCFSFLNGFLSLASIIPRLKAGFKPFLLPGVVTISSDQR